MSSSLRGDPKRGTRGPGWNTPQNIIGHERAILRARTSMRSGARCTGVLGRSAAANPGAQDCVRLCRNTNPKPTLGLDPVLGGMFETIVGPDARHQSRNRLPSLRCGPNMVFTRHWFSQAISLNGFQRDAASQTAPTHVFEAIVGATCFTRFSASTLLVFCLPPAEATGRRSGNVSSRIPSTKGRRLQGRRRHRAELPDWIVWRLHRGQFGAHAHGLTRRGGRGASETSDTKLDEDFFKACLDHRATHRLLQEACPKT